MPASALVTIMINAARKAGRSIARDFGEIEHLQVSVKGPGNFVSAADHRAETILYEELSRARHGYCFQMEERGFIEGPDKTHVWIVDPLDGTTNFLHGIPLFSISIALQREGEIVAGLIYNPATGDSYVAERGSGAFLNDRQRLRVAARSNLDMSVIGTGIPHRGKPGHERHLRELGSIMGASSGIRRTGAASIDLAWVAQGRLDGYWERDIQPWDIAAGMIIVREAGGFVSDISGGQDMLKSGTIIAGNEAIHRDIFKKLSQA